MGRGTIVSGGEDGLYTVRLDFGKAQRDARVAKADQRIERLNIEIAELADAIVLAEARTAEGLAALQAIIELMITAQTENNAQEFERLKKLCDEATAYYAKVAAEEAALRIPRELKIGERKTIVADKGLLLAAKVEEVKPAWCADLTEDATGEVATIDIPGEDQAVLIAPGGRPPVSSDGKLVAREIMSPEQAFFNAAILPGWQKFKPTYRKGTITFLDKDANIANVDLDDARSSANNLAINQSPELNGVNVRYMECHAEAFEVGDRVVIAFADGDWNLPEVIGFVDNPKPCNWAFYYSVADNELQQISLYIAALRPGLIPGINGTTPFTVYRNGVGPYVLQPFETLDNFWDSGFPPHLDPHGAQVSANLTPDFVLDGFTVPHGFFSVSISPPSEYLENPSITGLRSTCELIFEVGGQRLLQIAYTDTGWAGLWGSGTAQVKGAPIVSNPQKPGAVTKLEYTFVG